MWLKKTQWVLKNLDFKTLGQMPTLTRTRIACRQTTAYLYPENVFWVWELDCYHTYKARLLALPSSSSLGQFLLRTIHKTAITDSKLKSPMLTTIPAIRPVLFFLGPVGGILLTEGMKSVSDSKFSSHNVISYREETLKRKRRKKFAYLV